MARLAGGPPAALAGDQLVATLLARANDDRLQDALGADRVGEARGRIGVEPAARLTRVRVDRLEGEVHELRQRGAAHEHGQAPAEAAAAVVRRAASSARQAPTPPSS